MLITGHHQSCKVGKRIQFTCYPSTTRNTPSFYSWKCPGPRVMWAAGFRRWEGVGYGTDMMCGALGREGRAGWWVAPRASWGDSHEQGHRARWTAVLLLWALTVPCPCPREMLRHHQVWILTLTHSPRGPCMVSPLKMHVKSLVQCLKQSKHSNNSSIYFTHRWECKRLGFNKEGRKFCLVLTPSHSTPYTNHSSVLSFMICLTSID